MAAGEELLIAESAERDREGLRRLFDGEGYVCTVCSEPESAGDLVQRKFFPVALVDLDFGGTNGGLEFIRFIQEKSSPTKIVMLSGRRSYEAAVDALRLGVIDIVSKRPDQIHHLSGAVNKAVHRYRVGDKEGSMFREVRSLLDEAMKIMLLMGKKLYGGGSAGGSGLSMKPAILLIDEDQAFLERLTAVLASKPWDVSVELSGGSGLDRASSFSFQIIAVRDELMDLPGQMLIKSAQAQQTKCLGLLYSPATGRMERFEKGGSMGVVNGMEGPEQLVEQIDKLVGELSALREERRYVQAFRSDHGAFLKRFADLKTRIDALLD